PRHNFTELPRIRSERPAFELHYPHMIERIRAESHIFPLGIGRESHLAEDTAHRSEHPGPAPRAASAHGSSDAERDFR
ncbi:cytochrome ubiquinol oxidase subunit I, partial [Rhodococcus sp. As11]